MPADHRHLIVEPMPFTHVAISGIDGNSGRSYRIYDDQGRWICFTSMPGDERLYCGSVSCAANTSNTDEARRLVECHALGRLTGPSETAIIRLSDNLSVKGA